jgi:transposase
VILPGPIPEERRAAAVAEYRRRKAQPAGTTIREIAREFDIGEASLKRYLWLDRDRNNIVPKPRRRGGGGRRLSDEMRDELVAMVLAEPSLRLYEVTARISERAGFPVCERTVRRALKARGIGKRRLVRLQRHPDQPDSTRYAARHRRKPEGRPDRRAYPSDFTDAEWAVVGPLWEREVTSQPTDHELRDVLDAIRYVSATGCPWRYLPHDYPPHTTVYAWFERWARDGTEERVNTELRRLLRRAAGREETPSLLIIDSQTARSREGGDGRGYDAGKKLSGRKRHVAVDTLGLPWFVTVHSASVQDRDGIELVIPDNVRELLPRLVLMLGDGGYQGRAEQKLFDRVGVPLRIARRRGDNPGGEWSPLQGPPPTIRSGFQPIQHRWIVERTLAWANRRRRLSCDFERTERHSLAWFHHAAQFTMTAKMVA